MTKIFDLYCCNIQHIYSSQVYFLSIFLQIRDEYIANLRAADTKLSVVLAFHQAPQLSPVGSRHAGLLYELPRDATRDWRTRKCTCCAAAVSATMLKPRTARRGVDRRYTMTSAERRPHDVSASRHTQLLRRRQSPRRIARPALRSLATMTLSLTSVRLRSRSSRRRRLLSVSPAVDDHRRRRRRSTADHADPLVWRRLPTQRLVSAIARPPTAVYRRDLPRDRFFPSTSLPSTTTLIASLRV